MHKLLISITRTLSPMQLIDKFLMYDFHLEKIL